MQLGMVGLGRMGANMAERLRRGGHEVIGYDRNPDVSDVGSLSGLVERLAAPRSVWVMVPAGDPTGQTIRELAGLLQAGAEGAEAIDPDMPVMMHIALGGQNDEARFWLDNMIARGVEFDILGISYYPRWHGTLEDLYVNLHDLIDRYHKPINVVEYSDFKREVHDIVFNLPNDMGKGTAIWEPLGVTGWWGSGLFDQDGNVTDLMEVYDELNAVYIQPSNR